MTSFSLMTLSRRSLLMALTRGALTRAALAGVALTGMALVGRTPPAFAAEKAKDAGAFILGLAETAMKTVAVPGISLEERAERFDRLFVVAFNLPEIGRLVLGRYWNTTPPAQQQEFLTLFRDIQTRVWASRFKEYSGETLDVVSVSPEGENPNESRVDTKLNRKSLEPVNISWRVRRDGNTFHIMDIKVEGVSMALTHRSEYTSIIQRNGGQVDTLLAAMRSKLEQLKSGG